MLLYSGIMFLLAALFGWISMRIYHGETTLIHDYHQRNVTDLKAYGKAFGKAMFWIAATFLVSGITGLLGDGEKFAMIAVGILFLGLLIGIWGIVAVQRKYNKGVF